MSRQDLHFRLRLPPDLKAEIEAAAKANGCSMTAEIIKRLRSQSAVGSTRDRIAAMIAAGLCATPGGPFQSNPMSGWGIVNCDEGDIASTAYSVADALILESQKGDRA